MKTDTSSLGPGDSHQAGRLIQIYEELFLYICSLNRMKGAASTPSYAEVASRIAALREEIMRKAKEAVLTERAQALLHPVDIFVDSMIVRTGLPFAQEWKNNRLAKKFHGDQAGDATFFKLLNETLKESSDVASEILSVYYVCLGLGFTGALACHSTPADNKKDYAALQDYMRRIVAQSRHVRAQLPDTSERHVTPGAYHVSPGVPKGPVVNLLAVLACFLGVIIIFYLALVHQFKLSSKTLTDSLEQIRKNHEQVVQDGRLGGATGQ